MTTGRSGSSYMSSRRSILMCWCKGCLPTRSPRRRVLPQSLTVCVCSTDLKLVLSCPVLSCPVLSCLVLSCLVLPCLALFCLVLLSRTLSSQARWITLNSPAWLCIKPQHCIIDLLLHVSLQHYLNRFAWLFYLLASSQTDVLSKNLIHNF